MHHGGAPNRPPKRARERAAGESRDTLADLSAGLPTDHPPCAGFMASDRIVIAPGRRARAPPTRNTRVTVTATRGQIAAGSTATRPSQTSLTSSVRTSWLCSSSRPSPSSANSRPPRHETAGGRQPGTGASARLRERRHEPDADLVSADARHMGPDGGITVTPRRHAMGDAARVDATHPLGRRRSAARDDPTARALRQTPRLHCFRAVIGSPAPGQRRATLVGPQSRAHLRVYDRSGRSSRVGVRPRIAGLQPPMPGVEEHRRRCGVPFGAPTKPRERSGDMRSRSPMRSSLTPRWRMCSSAAVRA